MRQNKPRKYAVILQHPWRQGKTPLGIVISTSTRSANITALNKIKEATMYSAIKIRSVDFITVRPWRHISIGTRKLLIASGVRF